MDGAARRSLVTAVDRLAAAGAAVVLATHDEELAAAVADRVVHLG
jgi:energy-coupling factor transporter ATP-binding protein EcfA2